MSRAVKVLHPDVVEQRPDLWRRMELEAKVMNRLAHPNVVRVHDLVAQRNELCVVMDLADGGTLADWLVLLGPLPPRHALGFLVQVLSALATAHINGIVHRDVKPQNVLLDQRGIAMLSDFGAALHAGPGDDAMAVIGTTGFMAPEQCRGDLVAAAPADLYAVAATLYTLLTTRNPQGLSREPPDSPRWAGLTEELAALIRKGMAPNPADRFEDANQMAWAFEEAREAAPTLPLVAFEPDHEEFFPYAGEGSVEGLGWASARSHLAPSNTAIQVALSHLEDPLLFRETEAGASLLAEPTPETGGTLVAMDEDWEPPPAAAVRQLAPTEEAPATDEPLVVGFLTDGTSRSDPRDSETPLGYLPDDSEISDLIPPEASELPQEVLAAEWAERLAARQRAEHERRLERRAARREVVTSAGVHPLAPVAVESPETPPARPKPAPAVEPRHRPATPPLPVGALVVFLLVAAGLWAGFLLGRGPPTPVVVPEPALAEELPIGDLVLAPRPVEVRIETVETVPAAPVDRARPAATPLPSAGAAPTPAPTTGGIDPVGRWAGSLGGRNVEVVLRGRPSAFRGTVTSSFMTNRITNEVSGSYDPETRTLSFEDLEAVADAGRYVGTISEDGTRFDGYFERLDGVSRKTLILERAR